MTTQNIYDLVDTWALSGGPYTSIKMNATDNDAASASLLMDLQVGTVSKFSVAKNGTSTFGSSSLGLQANLTDIEFVAKASSVGAMHAGIYGIYMNSTLAISWSSSSTNAKTGVDTYLTRRAAANLRLGAADTTGTTAPTAQFLSAQSWSSSTTDNQTGANFTIDGSQGTGTGAGGSIIFRVAPAGGTSNGVQNGLATFLEATSARAFNLYNTTDVTTNFERAKIAWSSNVLQIGTEKGGTGTARALEFQTDGTTRLAVAATDGSITQTGGGFRINNPLGTQLWFGAESNSLTYVGAISNHSLQLRTNNTERLTLDTTGSVRVVTALTVATLPATPLTGMIARVTNALAPATGATVVGGVAAQALVWYNGANWTVIGV